MPAGVPTEEEQKLFREVSQAVSNVVPPGVGAFVMLLMPSEHETLSLAGYAGAPRDEFVQSLLGFLFDLDPVFVTRFISERQKPAS